MTNLSSMEGESHYLAQCHLIHIIGVSYLTSESDVDLLVRGVRLILKIAHSEPLRSQLEFRYRPSEKMVDEAPSDYFWLCDQDPDKACSSIDLRT